MFINIEGCDGTGKTQLANHISKLLGLDIVKFSKPEGDPYISYMEFLIKTKTPTILDRYYIGELVYGKVMRGKSELNDWKVRNIEMLLQMRCPLNIYCYTDPKTISKVFKTRGETYLQQDDINPILFNYATEVGKSRLKWHNYNYLEDKNYEKIDKLILYWYQYYLYNSSHIRDLIDNRTLGRYDSRTLVVGEVSNVKLEQEKYKHINVGFANGISSNILYASLPGRGKNVAITNLKKAHLKLEKGNLLAEIMLPKLKRVVCLGKEAYVGMEKLFKDYNIKHLDLKLAFHPAYVARGGATLQEYQMQLKELVI